MFLILFLLWLILNGRLAADVLLTGALVSAALTWFAYHYCNWSANRDRQLLLLLPQLAAYAVLLIKEIIKANLQVIRMIWSPNLKEQTQPQLVMFEAPLKHELARTLLANSITLTPGTITVRLRAHHYVVHALTPEMGKDLDDSSFVRALRPMEERLARAEAKKGGSGHAS